MPPATAPRASVSVPVRGPLPSTEDLAATQTSYDTVAGSYAALLEDELDARPVDRGLLAAFAETATTAGLGPVGDLGCGPGRVTGHLASLGVDAFGVDLSPGMVAEARRRHPDLRFEVGSILDLDLPDGYLGGALLWYSTVHTPPAQLPEVFAEVHRVLAPGAPLITAFKVGDRQVHLQHAYGHNLSLQVYWTPMELVTDLLDQAGLVIDARMVCEPAPHEKQPQGYVMAHRPA
ncbi:class I SAM-dependent methyltransferase [Oryzihumus leptocrescens]|uniref:class I SAM-dependent methyltransferase n=1 Tax=Oryzihumus leptocrescens TaxID=297536 RepID=UPI001FE94AE8|nr:class I SAM-dependent methyltransferase [Oryzihumus leptocrescens]